MALYFECRINKNHLLFFCRFCPLGLFNCISLFVFTRIKIARKPYKLPYRTKLFIYFVTFAHLKQPEGTNILGHNFSSEKII